MRLNRRQFLAALAAIAGAFGGSPGPRRWGPAAVKGEPLHAPPAAVPMTLRHLAWVWDFSSDRAPGEIRSTAAAYDLGIAVKTHDGTEWMSEHDPSAQAISGPAQVAALVRYFEGAGVPFHAWSVVKGLEPTREAEMCAEVLAAGARSMTIDLEPHAGFWEGTTEAALTFGRELRRRQPSAWLSLSLDPRPWVVEKVPLKEFASFSDEFAPQIYWDSFNTPPNWERFAESGWPPGPEGVTPQFLLDVTFELLRPYNLPVQPIGQGAAATMEAWKAFIDHAYSRRVEAVSVWRFATTRPEVWSLLKENAPRPSLYVVQPGDTLTNLAQRWRTSIQAIVELNQIPDRNLIRVGQQLLVPGRRGALAQAAASVYVVQPGDSLSRLAERAGTTVRAIADLNGIGNLDAIYIGQQLRLPGRVLIGPIASSVYTVQPGDTLTALAQRWSATIRAIADLNGIGNLDAIYVGQQLRVP